MRLPPLNAIRAFVMVARHLSFKTAAEALFVTPAAVTYQIKTLEDFLGVALFVRGHRSIRLTQAGQRCFDDLAAGFALIEQGISKATQAERDKQLIVTAGPAFTIKWLAPRLHEFSEQYPAIQASISASLHILDLQAEEADVAIRFGLPPDKQQAGLFYEVFATESVVPLCHPQFLDKPLQHPSELLDYNLIHDDSFVMLHQSPYRWQDWLAQAGVDTAVDSGTHFNQADHALQAAIDGNGIVLGRRVLATPDIQSGRLMVLFPELELVTHLKHYFVCMEEKRSLKKVCAFRQWFSTLPGLYQPLV